MATAVWGEQLCEVVAAGAISLRMAGLRRNVRVEPPHIGDAHSLRQNFAVQVGFGETAFSLTGENGINYSIKFMD
ncbi:hypothetical protein [Pararhizobium polonicum]|uniref:hypothetical protein n=1 Tax=Pararhizobium polonicum TaxID=1612624 RepID=UPI0011124981|nr:hypothetical protein [Pararhizobium polonicum]